MGILSVSNIPPGCKWVISTYQKDSYPHTITLLNEQLVGSLLRINILPSENCNHHL